MLRVEIIMNTIRHHQNEVSGKTRVVIAAEVSKIRSTAFKIGTETTTTVLSISKVSSISKSNVGYATSFTVPWVAVRRKQEQA